MFIVRFTRIRRVRLRWQREEAFEALVELKDGENVSKDPLADARASVVSSISRIHETSVRQLTSGRLCRIYLLSANVRTRYS